MHQTLKYRRYRSTRGQDWRPVGTSWQDPASAFLVAHDLYHHQPSDSGLFSQEIQTFGAEWYVNLEPREGLPPQFRDDPARQQGAVVEVLAGILDKTSSAQVFELPPCTAPAACVKSEKQFKAVAKATAEFLLSAGMLSRKQRSAYTASLVQHIRMGYWTAKQRYPDQLAVRTSFDRLTDTLRGLEEHEVPEGHLITLVRTGSEFSLHYEDADEAFRAMPGVLPAFEMPWYFEDNLRECAGFTLHRSEAEFNEFVDEHFAQEDTRDRIIPGTYAEGLEKVFVVEPSWREALEAGKGVRLAVDQLPPPNYSPRGFRIYGAIS